MKSTICIYSCLSICTVSVGIEFDLAQVSRDAREFLETNSIVLYSAGKFVNCLCDVVSILAGCKLK